MKLLLSCLLLVAASLVIDAKPFDKLWSDCSTADDKTRATVQSITVNPDTPKKGEDITILATFTLKENITTGSKAVIEAKLDGIKLYSGTFDLCKDVLPQVNLNCPVAATQHSITIKTKIPEIAPRGHYTANARAIDQNGKEFACLNADAKLE